MAGTTRNVTVNVIGNASGLTNTLGGVAATGEATGGRLSSAFKTSMSAISAASGGAFGPIQEAMGTVGAAMEGFSGKTKSAAEKMGAIGLGAAGAGAALTAMGSKDQSAQQQLAAAITATGGSYDDYKGKIEETIKSMAKYGDSSSQTQNALQSLTLATKDPQKALDLMGTAPDLAAAKHESLGTAVSQLTQIIAGKGTKTLQSLGIQHIATANTAKDLEKATKGVETSQTALSAAQQKLADLEAVDHGKKVLTIGDQIALRNAHERVTAAEDKLTSSQRSLTAATTAAKAPGDNVASMLKSVADVTKGQASAASDTFTGKLAGLKTSIENTASALGQKYGPALTTAGAGVATLGAAVSGAQKIHEAFTHVETLGKIATDAETAAKALGTVATEAETAADTALVPEETLTLGPILLIIAAVALLAGGIYLLVTHWKESMAAIKTVMLDAWHFIDNTFIHPIEGFFTTIVGFVKNHWQLILAVLTGPIGLAVLFIKDHFDGVVNFFTGMPGRIGRAVSGMWDSIKNGFRDAINAVIDLWNDLHFKLPSIDWGPMHLHGGTIGVPHIAHLAAGGIVTSPTLALLGESGPERVTPLTGSGAGAGVAGGGHGHDIYLDGRLVGQATAPHVRTALLQTTARNAAKVGLG